MGHVDCLPKVYNGLLWTSLVGLAWCFLRQDLIQLRLLLNSWFFCFPLISVGVAAVITMLSLLINRKIICHECMSGSPSAEMKLVLETCWDFWEGWNPQIGVGLEAWKGCWDIWSWARRSWKKRHLGEETWCFETGFSFGQLLTLSAEWEVGKPGMTQGSR